MLFCNFQHYLKKLNPNLIIDVNNEQTPYGTEFKLGGLYLYEKGSKNYLFAVPHGDVFEYSIEELSTERRLSRGYKSILAELIRRGLVSHSKAERLFQTYIPLNQINFPTRKIKIDFSENYKRD